MHRELSLQQHLSKTVVRGGHRVPFMTTHANADWQDKTRQVSIPLFFWRIHHIMI